MNNVQTLPGAFPLAEDREFLSESEWVILKLLCRPVDGLADADAEELSQATGGQITVARCDELIRTVRIHRLDGLGSWAARLLAGCGLSDADMLRLDAAGIVERVNASLGYAVFNAATMHALASLQQQWRKDRANDE